jgi:hypothetical protein
MGIDSQSGVSENMKYTRSPMQGANKKMVEIGRESISSHILITRGE